MSTQVRLVKAMVFPVVLYGCESWTIKKAEHGRTGAFKLWCWRRFLRVPWTARRSSGLISLRMDWSDLLAVHGSLKSLFSNVTVQNHQLQSKGLSRVFPNSTVQKHQFLGTQPSLQGRSFLPPKICLCEAAVFPEKPAGVSNSGLSS